MNRNRYRLVFNETLGMMVPVAESARRAGKSSSRTAASGSALALAGVLLASPVWAELPVPSTGGGIPNFVTAGQAAYQVKGTQAFVNQLGSKSILNWQSFNVSPGHNVQFRQVDSLAANNLVQGASFTSLNRIWDINPSVIAGSISQAAGQKANLILVNQNGIAFMGSSQVNLNQFTASTLNLADAFVLGDFLTNQGNVPQFEKALDGGEARGFIKVMEGARISATDSGRVMLLAPTVVNRGTVSAADGQVIAAAGSKAFLSAAGNSDRNVRGLLVEVDSPAGLADFDTTNTSVKDGQLDGQTVALANAAEDKLGHVSNFGELTTPRGNVTMIGYAVNQNGIARATSSVVANGSVYLLAKDRAVSKTEATRGGRVTMGAGSLTEILPETADTTGALDGDTGEGLALRSQVLALGEGVEMAGGAAIHAPSADVNLVAMDNPGLRNTTNDPLNSIGASVSSQARVRVASSARIDVAGLSKVQVSAARNAVEVELRGDELKDSPLNQSGPLRGEKVYLDVERALDNSDAGLETLIARDSLENYRGRLERTAAERSTLGGTVNALSQGETLIEQGARIDLSGGSVDYTAANVKTTLLSSGGKLIDLADADTATHYDGIATRFVTDYGRWNRKETIDLGQSYRYDPGYVDGKDAGSLNVLGMKSAIVKANIEGRTVTGERQRAIGMQPAGATLRVGKGSVAGDYKHNQRVVIGTATPADVNTLALNTGLFGKDRVANLEIFSNQAAEVREALRLPQSGSVAITAKGVAVNADIEAGSGRIALNARANNVDTAAAPLDVRMATGVTLSARGGWTIDLPTVGGTTVEAPRADAGSVSLLAAGDVTLDEASVIDVTGGSWLQSSGKLKNGKGGDISLEAGAGASAAGSHTARVKLGGTLKAQALGKGGSLKINTGKIQLGGVADPDVLNLDTGFVSRGGFASFNLTGRDGVAVADGVTLTPRVESLELQPGYALLTTGSRIENVTRTVTREDRIRQAANLTLTADGSDAGVVRLGSGARIEGDDRATLVINGGKGVEIQGTVRTAGGTISAAIVPRDPNLDYDPANTVWLGANAVLDASGAARTYTDTRGLQAGEVLGGGTVALNANSGFVVTEQGSIIRSNGVEPVRLDVPNETGGLGRMIASDAGTIRISAREGALLDGSLEAHAGSGAQRGGEFDFNLGSNVTTLGAGYPAGARTISLAPTVAAQATGLAPGGAMPASFNGQARLDAGKLEAAGFERVALKSQNAIRLENDLNMGVTRNVPLREIRLDAPRLETAGSDAVLTAQTIRLGNYDAERQDSGGAPVTGTGVLRANTELLELAGKQTLSGMVRAELTGKQEIRLAGISTSATPQPTGELKTAADLVLHGALVAPASYTQYTLDATNRTVAFSRTAQAPAQPYSALGKVMIKAKDIVQGGNLWAPLGTLDLQASDSLIFENGSLTSVAASGMLPFGKLENGRAWVLDINGNEIAIDTLPEKSIQTEAARIDMQTGARIDVSGGGDLQAYEFTVGPGGSRDILADKNTYAILPGYNNGFAPNDPQESFDRASGEAIYLSGVPGLKDGIYTLLPAHYALLLGAYAIKLGAGNALPGQAYTRQDGIRVAAGYLTDTRTAAPRDANWQGIQVLTHDQVRARSEFTLTRASNFFADQAARPQDAGRLSIRTTGTGADAFKLDAMYGFNPAAGGRGGQLDFSALKLAVTSGSAGGLSTDTVLLDADKLNAIGADSLLLGATRSRAGDTTTLDVGAEQIMLANDAAHALRASEVILAATDNVTLKSGSAIEAQGTAGDAGRYTTSGNGAFIRAAATTASFSRTGNPDRSLGTLVGESGSKIVAADSVTLDATRDNTFEGEIDFSKTGMPVVGKLAVGATRVSFGAAPDGTDGLVYSQAELDALDLGRLTLTSYSTFDFHGGVAVGKLNGDVKPVLQALTLQGAGLAGVDNAGQTAQLNAQHLTLTNPGNSAVFTPGGTLGSGQLALNADTLTLGAGDKQIQGFGGVTVNANELVGAGNGTLAVSAPLTVNVSRISGEKGANQTLESTGALNVASRIADRALAPTTALGGAWALKGTAVDFDSVAELGSGTFKLTATAGDVILGAHARVDVAGRGVRFFDVTKPSSGGTAEFVSDTGNVAFANGARVDVSAVAGGDTGTLVVRAKNGRFDAVAGSIVGQAPADANGKRGEGARARVDVGMLASFSDLNAALNAGGFDGERDMRVRAADVLIDTNDSVRAESIRIAVDSGDLTVRGTLDASGAAGGQIALMAGNHLDVEAGAQLLARADAADEDGGSVELGSENGTLDLASGSLIDVRGGANGQDGVVHLSARRDGSDVAVGTLDGSLVGARAVNLEAVKTYTGISTLNATGASSGNTLSLATINADNMAYAANHGAIKTRLGKAGDSTFHLLSGVEVRAPGTLTLAQDWNLKDSRAGGEAGVLTLRAAGNLDLDSNLSDGFSHATAFASGTTPATLLSGASWSYRLVGGADLASADALATTAGAGDVTLKAGKLVRTGTGDIRMAAGKDIRLADNKSVVYTAGRLADPLPGFTNPANAQFSIEGGKVSLTAQRDIVGAPSAQLYSNWLFRQGRLNADGSAYTTQPAWWVRFDQFQQGVGALGGGDVSLVAGGRVENVSASTPSQARMASATPDAASLVKTGGGNLTIETGGDLLGGQYYADEGELAIRAGGKVDSGQGISGKPLYTILALGDAKAQVQSLDDINLHAIINPHLVVQSSGTGASVNVNNAGSAMWSVFSTYGEDSLASMESLSGDVNFHNAPGGSATLASMNSATGAYKSPLNFTLSSANYNPARAFALLPSSLAFAAFQGDVLVGGTSGVMRPAASGDLDVLAAGSVNLTPTLTMSDMAPMPDALNPASNTNAFSPTTLTAHASQPVHAGDVMPVRVYAVAGDVKGIANKLNLVLPKAARVKAGQDVRDLGMSIQHVNQGDVSQVEAGRDVAYSSAGNRTSNAYLWVAGPGRLEVTAGRNVDLGTSAGIVSRGNLDNAALPAGGANIHATAGVGAGGIDYARAVDRLIDMLSAGEPDDTTLWMARWLTGNKTLSSSEALAAVSAVDALDADSQRDRVRNMLFAALRTTGRDSLDVNSPYAADYARGYATLELIFPGISERNEDGSFRNYQGEINLFASRILTERGGDIEFVVPGGDVIVGLSNTPAALLQTQVPGSGIGLTDSGVLGMAVIGEGDMLGVARGDVLVNQSRILTVGGGDVLLWSSEGDIDAGKGKKTAATVPPPLILVDAQGNVTQVLQGAASGSGIGALTPAGGTAGDVDLIAPQGTVNAGDAGIRAANLNIAAQVVLGADNISVTGTSTGTPVADTSAITATSSGATSSGGSGVSDAVASMSQNLAESTREAEDMKKIKKIKPTFISAEVIGHGD